MKQFYYLITLLVLLSISKLSFSQFTVSTFECISVYWSPSGGSNDKEVSVEFRVNGASEWKDGLSMRYNPIGGTTLDGADYRGSIVNLTPNTEYEIKLTLENTSTTSTITATTWTEDFPIGQTITPGNLSSGLNITNSGTPDGYILYDGTGDTIDVNNSDDACITISGNYIIIRGYNLTGGKKYGIELEGCHDVIIENCDITNWGEEWQNGVGVNYQGAISAHWTTPNYTKVERIVVQRCKIYHPRYGTNSWAEEGSNGNGNTHPTGPQAIALMESNGNNVFRYNEVWSDQDHYFNDIFGMLENNSYEGFPGADTDIYGNSLQNCWDNALELDGGNRNVRVWGNYTNNVYQHISNTGTNIGPLYVWGNVHGKSYSVPGSRWGEYAAFMKMGETSFKMHGHIYVFNNTLVNINNDGSGGMGTQDNTWGRYVLNTISRNNILHVRSGRASISDYVENHTSDYIDDNQRYANDYDYDLNSGGYPAGQEQNGISGTPTYQSGSGFNSTNQTASYFLEPGTSGIDDGVVIPNFRENYTGDAPDMGAFETGGAPMEFGVNAYNIQYTLTTSAGANGSISPSGANLYNEGTVVTIKATGDLGYGLDAWGGN